MPSLFERPELNKIFLLYGALDDMFVSSDLQKNNFRPYLNAYLKGLGYDRVVFYSGAKNNGKYVLDDKSAVLAINKNKNKAEEIAGQPAQTDKSLKKRVRNPFLNPRENAYSQSAGTPAQTTADGQSNTQGAAVQTQQAQFTGKTGRPRRVLSPRQRQLLNNAQAAVNSQTQTMAPTQTVQPVRSQPTVNAKTTRPAQAQTPVENTSQPQNEWQNPGKLTYCQPKMTPAQFLDEAKAMMADSTVKTAIVFPFFQDFVTAQDSPMQQYSELLSHLWDEYALTKNDNICVFLAPGMDAGAICGLFGRLNAGDVFKSRFFNENGSINKGCTLQIGLPNADEIINMLDYLRLIGDGGKRITFERANLKRIASLIMYYSREAERDENRAGYLNAIYENIAGYIRRHPGDLINFDEGAVKAIYRRSDGADDPLQKLRDTRGWEPVYSRVNEILNDYKLKKAAAAEKHGPLPDVAAEVSQGQHNGAAMSETQPHIKAPASSRIEPQDDDVPFDYKPPNFVIKGNPGVGKTTVARLMGQIFYDAGILKNGMVIEATRRDLVDQYVGGTAHRTRALIERAQEGVLFIDDAYSLFEEEGEGAGFAHEAVNELVAAMTNPKQNRFCLILAGYPDKMDGVLGMNAGLASRFSDSNIITIEDYPPEVLKHIFTQSCMRDGFTFAGEGINLTLFFENMYARRDRANFGNARDVVSLAEEVKSRALARNPQGRVITAADFGAKAEYFAKRGAASIQDVYAELDKFVGLGFVRDIFEKVRLELNDAQDMRRRGLTPEALPDHYIFAGNPGTGKTTVGKLMGEFYGLMGVLGGRQTIFADASELIGSHVGDSAQRVAKKIQEAIDKNALLYIDEAYQIADSPYKDEIIGAMMTRMTENKDGFKMVFGMYKNRVEDFLKLNAGLSRRLRVIDFPDYTPEQLLEIFRLTIAAQGRTITQDAEKTVGLVLKHMYDTRTDSFGNAGEVKKLADEMRALLLKRTETSPNEGDRYVYTQQDIPKDKFELVKNKLQPRTFSDIMADLNELTGLEDLKAIVEEKRDAILYAKKCGEPLDNITPGYYFFIGNPGTGKTTSAKLFAECLHELGIIKSANFYSCTAKDLIAEYVGQTDKKTYEMLKKSQNGVLFIDEAYDLASDGEPGGASFKKEALNQIVAYMEDPEHRKKSCIIMAGYEKDMQGIYRSNAGMRSRIDKEVVFKDYTPQEMWDIFLTFCKKAGFTPEDGVRQYYTPIFARLAGAEYFSNARTARQVFEKTAAKVKRRVVRQENITPRQAKAITKDDLLTKDECMALVTSGGA